MNPKDMGDQPIIPRIIREFVDLQDMVVVQVNGVRSSGYGRFIGSMVVIRSYGYYQ